MQYIQSADISNATIDNALKYWYNSAQGVHCYTQVFFCSLFYCSEVVQANFSAFSQHTSLCPWCFVCWPPHTPTLRWCISPEKNMPASRELPTVLHFDQHQNFVEFGNGYALLMNCGGAAKERQHCRCEPLRETISPTQFVLFFVYLPCCCCCPCCYCSVFSRSPAAPL